MKTIILLFGLLSLSACVSTMHRPVSIGASAPVPIYADDFVPSKWDLPVGSNVVAESNLVVRNAPSTSLLYGAMLFGPLGVAALDAAMSTGAEEIAQGIDAFALLELPHMATEVLVETQRDGQMPPLLVLSSDTESRDAYQLQPFIYLETDGTNRSDLMLVLRVTQAKTGWMGQYVSHLFGIAEVKQIRYSAVFREAIKTALKQALQVFYQDIQGKLVKIDKKIVPSITKSMFYRDSGLWGWKLSSLDKDLFLFQARTSPKNVFGGVHIFNAADVATKSL